MSIFHHFNNSVKCSISKKKIPWTSTTLLTYFFRLFDSYQALHTCPFILGAFNLVFLKTYPILARYVHMYIEVYLSPKRVRKWIEIIPKIYESFLLFSTSSCGNRNEWIRSWKTSTPNTWRMQMWRRKWRRIIRKF